MRRDTAVCLSPHPIRLRLPSQEKDEDKGVGVHGDEGHTNEGRDRCQGIDVDHGLV